MRIAYLCNAKAHHFVRWFEYFMNKGHTVFVVSGDTRLQCQANRPPEGVKVYYLPERRFQQPHLSFGYNMLRLPFIVGRLKQILDELAIDILHAHSLQYGFWGALSGFHPFVVTPIGSDAIVRTRQYFLYRKMAAFVYSKADLITQDSLECRRVSLELGAREEKSLIIQNGVDLTRFHPNIGGGWVRERLGLGDEFLILHTREMRPLYNIERLVEGFALFRARVPRTRLLLAYLIEGSKYEQKIRELVKDLGIADSVIFHGYIPLEETPHYQAAADVHVSVPLSDSMPSSVTEAMAVGTPVVTGRLPWTEYFMKDGENCILVNYLDPEDIYRGLMLVYESKDLREKLRKGGLETVREHLDYHENMARMEELMEELCAGVRMDVKPKGVGDGVS